MEISDRLKTGANEAVETAKGAAKSAREAVDGAVEKHGDKVADSFAKAGSFVDDKTGGRFHSHIDKGVNKVQEVLHKPENEDDTDIDSAVDVEADHTDEGDTTT